MSLVYSEYILRLIKPRTMITACFLSVIFLEVSLGHTADTTTRTHRSPVVCPSSCYCDDNGEYVSCVGDGLWRFPLEVANTTIRLELRNYLVKEVSSEDFINLVDIEELKLQQSHIETIENGSFIGNSKLQRLDLSQNILTGLSSSVFNSLLNLRYLDLSSNLIEFVEQAFVGLVNLEQLNLRDNMLQQLTANTFLGLQKVQYLNLDTNNISSIEVGTFQYLTNLAHLIISNNPLTSLSRLDFFGSRLQFIDISHVGLNIIPQSLTKFVRDLRLAKNNLTHISAGDFDSYPYLGLLVLDDNCVSEIENDALGRQEYLMRLWLNGNCLTSVPPNLPPSLLALYMEENKLTQLTSYSFKGLVHLEQLFLQRNEIKYLAPCVFCDLSGLKSLDLQANQIENLTSGIFNNLTQLQTLDLSQNNLKYIDYNCFDGLTYLKTLQMSRVHTFVELSESMFDPLHSLQTLEVYDSSNLVHMILNSTRMLHGLRKVQELNLMHNHIVKLRADFPSFFPSLRLIKLSGNIWHCDDNIQWLSTWIKQSNVQFYSSYNVRCATPENLLFKPLMMLIPSDFYTTADLTSTQTVLTLKPSILFTTSAEGVSTKDFSHKPEIYFSETSSTLSSTEMNTEVANLSQISTSDKDIPVTHPYQYEIITDRKTEIEQISTVRQDPINFNTDRTDSASPNVSPTTVTYSSVHYLTSEDSHTTETKEDDTLNSKELKTQNSSEYGGSKESNLQTISPQRRVLSSRLRVAADSKASKGFESGTLMFLGTAAVLVGLIVAILFLTVSTCARIRRQYQPVKHRNIRRSSSISYYPQKDEVSIVTLTEGTVGVRTTSHHGVGNKLYYIMENCGSSTDANTDAVPDSQLQELLPQSPKQNAHVY